GLRVAHLLRPLLDEVLALRRLALVIRPQAHEPLLERLDLLRLHSHSYIELRAEGRTQLLLGFLEPPLAPVFVSLGARSDHAARRLHYGESGFHLAGLEGEHFRVTIMQLRGLPHARPQP